MISIHEAKKRILVSITPQPPETVPLSDAVGRVLAERIVSPHPLPLFDNSAMDGYALRSTDTVGATEENPTRLRIVASVAAGEKESDSKRLRIGETARIFTGAMIPSGTDAVMKQEEVIREESDILITRPVTTGEFVRYRGEEIEEGDLLLERGHLLTPASVGLLASVGLKEVPIAMPPRVGILITGSEIVPTDGELTSGKIFDANTFSLTAALAQLRITPVLLKRSSDDREELRNALTQGFDESDFLLVSGGVSVGDFDFVKDAARELGCEEIFWRIKQKPGKPLYFGRLERGTKSRFIFGLPGNPASSLVCFYEYIRPALLHAMGSKSLELPVIRAALRENFKKAIGLAHFMKGHFTSDATGNHVEVLSHQGSHMIGSMAMGNCLVVLPEDQEKFEAGEMVEVHLLPT